MRAATLVSILLAWACCGRRLRLTDETAQRTQLAGTRVQDEKLQLALGNAQKLFATLFVAIDPLAAWQVANTGCGCSFTREQPTSRACRQCRSSSVPARAAFPILGNPPLSMFGDPFEDDAPQQKQADKPEPVGFAVGIDLGTTTSAIAVVENDKPKVVHKINSVVRPLGDEFPPKDSVVGGIASESPGAIFSAKRLIGQTYKAADETLPKHCELRNLLAPLPPQNDCPGTGIGTERAGLFSSALGEVLPPEWVGSQVLMELLDASEEATGIRAEKAVIGVPAHFSNQQREATLAAASLAGLTKVKVITEPVAAALAYDVLQGSAKGLVDELICVYDLGGGTLDVSILHMGGGTAEVLAGAGEPWLGGDDFDAAFAAFLARKVGLPASEAAATEFVAVARSAKEKLTHAKKVNVSVPLRAKHRATAGSGLACDHMTMEVSRRDLSRACSKLITKMKLPLLNAAEACRTPLRVERSLKKNSGGTQSLARPSTSGKRIDRVLLVGGASRMMFIREFLEEMTGVKPSLECVKPEDAVACGAAVQAAMLQGELVKYDIFSPLEAAYIRGRARGSMKQNEWKKFTKEYSDGTAKNQGKSGAGKVKGRRGRETKNAMRVRKQTTPVKPKSRAEQLAERSLEVSALQSRKNLALAKSKHAVEEKQRMR